LCRTISLSRHIDGDILDRQKIIRHFFNSKLRYNIWIKQIIPLRTRGGGFIVEYDEYDFMMRFEQVSYFDSDFNMIWVKEVSTEDTISCYDTVSDFPIPQFKVTPNRGEVNSTIFR